MKEVRKPEYPEKTPGYELQKMPHTKARKVMAQARLEPAHTHTHTLTHMHSFSYTAHYIFL